MKDTEKIVFGQFMEMKKKTAQLLEVFEVARRVYRVEMKTAVLSFVGLIVLGIVWAQENTGGKPSELRDALFMARSVRAKLFPFRGFCGRYRDPCGILIPCCEREGFDCDYSGGFHMGKCLKDWKKK